MKLRVYRVNYSRKPGTYTTTGNYNVLTTDVVRAVELTKQQYPDCMIWSISHIGHVDIIDTYIED